MPLYQLILISKALNPQQSASFFSKVAKTIWKQGGSVRDIKILSDRLLSKQAKAVDGSRSIIGRYNQVLFDGSPYIMDKIRKQLKLDKNVLKIDHFRIKDFYTFAQEFTKPVSKQSFDFGDSKNSEESLIKQDNRKMDIARKIAILKQQSG